MLNFKVITDIDQCKSLWQKFSPNKTLWELWDIAYSFNKGYDAQPLFILGIKDDEEIGILHLQREKNKEKEWTDFFGGNYPESISFYINDKSLINDFLAQAPIDINLSYIDPSEKQFANDIKEDEVTYSLDLERFGHDAENYIKSFNKKHRKNFRYDMRQIEGLGYKVIKDPKLERMVELNKQRFGEDSDFVYDSHLEKSFSLVIDSAQKLGILHFLGIEIDGKVEAAQIGLFFNHIYYVLTGGSNPAIKNLGKMMILEHIRNAARLKARKVEFMATDTGWKKLWNLDQTMLYRFDKTFL